MSVTSAVGSSIIGTVIRYANFARWMKFQRSTDSIVSPVPSGEITKAANALRAKLDVTITQHGS